MVYTTIRTRQRGPKQPGIIETRDPSLCLATFETVPTISKDQVEKSPDEYRLVEEITDARAAINAVMNRLVDCQKKVIALIGAGVVSHAKRLEVQYVKQGKWIPFEEVVPTGFYGIDIKQNDDPTSPKYRSLTVHMHILVDVAWLPHEALSELWDHLIASPPS